MITEYTKLGDLTAKSLISGAIQTTLHDDGRLDEANHVTLRFTRRDENFGNLYRVDWHGESIPSGYIPEIQFLSTARSIFHEKRKELGLKYGPAELINNLSPVKDCSDQPLPPLPGYYLQAADGKYYLMLEGSGPHGISHCAACVTSGKLMHITRLYPYKVVSPHSIVW